MKFAKITFEYLKKNILYVLLFALVPTVFIGVLLNPFSLFEFICKYPSLMVTDFCSIFNELFNFSFLNIFLFVLGLILLSIFISMLVGQLENHMRSGKLNIKSSPSFVNNNFLVVFVNLSILVILLLVLLFLYSAIMCLIQLIFCGLNTTPSVLCQIIAIILASGVFILFMQISAIFLLNIPNMLINGYPAKQAITNSLKLLNTNNFSFLLALVSPFIVIIPLVCIFSGFAVVVANIIGVLILLIYLPVLVMTSYFSLSNTTRYDNRKYYNYTLN